MNSDKDLSDQYAAAANGLAATACASALTALRTIANDESAIAAMSKIHQLNQYARRIQTSLETGEAEYRNDNTDKANLEWASALVLMDSMSVQADNFIGSSLVDYAVDLQNSGKTA